MSVSKEKISVILRKIINPENEKDIISSGLVKTISITESQIKIDIEFDKPNNPIKSNLEKAIISLLKQEISNDISVQVHFTSKKVESKPVNQKNQILPNVKNIIAIASGKGGVGKSTVASNLAISIAKSGYSVGLIDADIFGPSLPKMFGAENEHPLVKKIDGKDIIFPIEKYGIKILSIGFFVDPDSALIWRGPMATNALQQLILDAAWGKLDYLLIDLPPGTSDIHLTLVQTLPVTGVIIVTTPQSVAIADAIKGIGMFRSEKINIPVLGIVENMSWFTPKELPENKYFIFGKDGAKVLSEKFNIPVLGRIPLIQSICESGDEGTPVVLDEKSIEAIYFSELTKNVLNSLIERNKNLAPAEKVIINPDAGCSVKK